MMSLACGHADKAAKRVPSMETQAGQAQALLPRDIQQNAQCEGWPGSSCREHVDSARLEGWLFAMRVPVYNMNTNVHVHRHTHIHRCSHVYTHPLKTIPLHSYMHRCLFMIGTQGERSHF